MEELGLKELLKSLEALSLYALLAVISGFMVIPGWRKQPQMAFAGFILAVLGGAIVTSIFGTKWALLSLFIMAFAGPSVILYLNNPDTIKQLIDTLADVFKSRKP